MFDTEIEALNVRYRTVKELLNNNHNYQFLDMLKSLACLSIRVEAKNGDNILLLIEMINELAVKRKTLHLIIPPSNLKTLENITINYDVIMHHVDKGNILSQ